MMIRLMRIAVLRFSNHSFPRMCRRSY